MAKKSSENVQAKGTAIVAALPIGEVKSDDIEAILGAFKASGAELIISDAVSDEKATRESVRRLSEGEPDLLLVIPSRGLSAQAMETAAKMSHVPCLIWPIQGNFAFASSTLAVGALQESRHQVELLYAPPENPVAVEKAERFMKAAKAYTRIHRSSVGIIGELFPNLTSCRYDPQIVESKLGVKTIPISFEEVRDSIKEVSKNIHEIEQLRQNITSSYSVKTEDADVLNAGIELHLALKRIAQDRNIDGFAAECWTGFPAEIGLNPCLGSAEDAYTLACEGDVMLCISLLVVQYLTGINPYAGDVYDLDMEGVLTLVHCGAPASLASESRSVTLGRSQLARERGFDTITCRPNIDHGNVTVFRLHGWHCDKMHLALGEVLSCDPSPSLKIRARICCDRWDFLNHCVGNHYVLAPGDIRDELGLLCEWLGITIYET